MGDREDGAKKIKVVDRRWFTGEGELRPDRPKAAPAKDASPAGAPLEETSAQRPPASPRAPADEVTRPRAEGAGAAAGPAGEWPTKLGFVNLLEFMAQQAVVLMSGAQGVSKNPSQAKVFIDFLGILEEKTRGNLSTEEEHLLSDLLFQLRTLFVQSTS